MSRILNSLPRKLKYGVFPALLLTSLFALAAELGVVPQPPMDSDPFNPPPPKSTPSANNGPALIARPAGAELNVPPGFEIGEFARGLSEPRNMLLVSNGDILVTEPGGNRVSVLRDADGDGKAEFKSTLLTNVTRPFGIALRGDFLYLGLEARVVRVPYKPGDDKITATPETVIGSIPTGGHWTRNILFTPDGSKMYLAVGSAGNLETDDPPIRAAITEYSDEFKTKRTFANGLRNPVGLAWEPVTGALWTCVNERDGLGDNTPPDYATSVVDGGFYGWPYAYLGNHPDPNFGSRRPDLVAKSIFPDVPIQAHSAPLGIAFNTGNLFPAAYQNGLFIANHGSWNRSKRTGYNVLFQPMKNGRPEGRYVVFANGWATPTQQVWGRPVSVTFAADGALLISDDGGGKIWRVTPQPGTPGAAGDVNEDGIMNLQDVILVLRAVVGATTLSPVQTFAADQHPVGAPDNKITIADVMILLRMSLGLPVK